MRDILLITLSYNRKSLIGQTIKSVLSQTLPRKNFNYLIFDNNSSDGAKKIISIVSKKYDNIHHHFNDSNLGQQKAFNKILYDIIPQRFSKTSIIAILDDDDMLYPEALTRVHAFYTAHKEVAGTYSGFSIINDHNRIKVREHSKSVMMPDQFSKNGQLALRKRFVVSNPIGHLRTYKVSALRDIGGFDETRTYATDYNIFGHLLEQGHVIAKIPAVIYKFRQHGFGQVESKHSPEQTRNYYELQEYFKERWKKMGLL